MNRRQFIGTVASASIGVQLRNGAIAESKTMSDIDSPRGTFAMDMNRIRFFSPMLPERFNIAMIADTHLFIDDKRGDPFREFSGRMARAYNQTNHFQTGEPTNPEKCFQESLAIAKEAKADLVALVGDIVSFPSEAAVDWVHRQIDSAGMPYVYTAGNHDWHYEGMPGTIAELRKNWIEKRLLSLYQTKDPMMSVSEVKGVKFVTIDDSTYDIQPEQLEFFRNQVASGQPIVLMIHIPLYAPGRSVGYGCGHPEWGAKSDNGFQIERRPTWPLTGHSEVTMAFHREVFSATNVLGVLAGHIHQHTLDIVNGIPQVVVGANATGAFLSVEFVPTGA